MYSCLIIFLFALVQANEDTFFEELRINQVNNEQLYSFFNFTTTWNYKSSFAPQYYHLFPRSIGQLIMKYNIAEFHFTMSQGFWRHEHWGFPFVSSPTGAQLWAWFHKNTEDIDKNWVGFTNALSGLFCASLNFMNKGITTNPIMSFRPVGLVENGEIDNKFLRYAELARENLCTENLTPWTKLLPCGLMSGPASLLNPRYLQHSHFFSIGLHFFHNCAGTSRLCIKPFVELQQHVSVVFDLRSLRTTQKKFSLISLFGKSIKPACPVASKSDVIIKMLPEVEVRSDLMKTINDQHHLNLFNITEDISTDIEFIWIRDLNWIKSFFANVKSNCHVTGVALDGGLECSILNNLNYNLTIKFFQVIPWYLHVKLHTLKIESNNKLLKPLHLSFTPAIIRESPYRLEFALTLPSMSTVDIKLKFIRGFLKWTEHPPDSNHGFYISPSVITMQTKDLNFSDHLKESVYHIYSEALIVNVPVPDFSMPYNVICLVSTVIAISFGTFYNLIAKRVQFISISAPHPLKQLLISLTKKLFKKKKLSG